MPEQICGYENSRFYIKVDGMGARSESSGGHFLKKNDQNSGEESVNLKGLYRTGPSIDFKP